MNYNTKDLNLALGDLSTFICGPTNVPGGCFPAQSTRIVMGWTAGGGTEYRLPGTNVTIFAQYLYMHLGGSGVVNAVNIATRPAPFGPPASFAATFTGTEFQTVKVGLNLELCSGGTAGQMVPLHHGENRARRCPEKGCGRLLGEDRPRANPVWGRGGVGT